MKKLALLSLLALVMACSSGAAVDRDALTDTDGNGGGGGGNDVGTDISDPFGDGKGTLDDAYVPPKPGEFGAPCTSNDDCISGYCIEGLDGYICTKICMEDCPEGYDCVGVNIGSDLVFICVPMLDRSCEPCASDLQCSGGRCVQFGGGSYCLSPCADSPCKESYECQNVQIGNAAEKLCMPDSGTCECVPASIGLEKACKAKAGTNVCYGIQFCEEAGWGDCVLPEEICDGKDNDCNGTIDDGMLNSGTGKYDTDEHCGVCNNSCTAMTGPHAFGSCDASGTVPGCTWSCEDGYFDVNENPNDGCECHYVSAADNPDVAGDTNCDGLEGVAADGIFVAKDGNDAAPGTWEAPVLSVQQGIDLAQQSGKQNVYVATGVYSEAIHLLAGVKVYGGYSADFLARDPAINQTVIMGPPATPEAPGAVNCIDITEVETVFSGFHVFGGDAIANGASSYALYVNTCDDSVRIVNNWVIGGNGRDGVHGEDGTDGADGLDGTGGEGAYDIMKDTCTMADWTVAGQGGTLACGGTNVSGGNGGNGICPDHDESGSQPKSLPYDQSHTADETGKPGDGPGGGDGGEAGWDALLWSGSSNCGVCNVPKAPDGSVFIPSLGTGGGNGDKGTNGSGAGGCVSPDGTVSGGLWLGIPGSDGTNGGHGAGGGGGGAGGGVETIGCANVALMKYTDIGGSGGGGGSGGCAGTAGTGGQPGGASFALFISGPNQLASLPELENNVIQTGFGGDGGDGGAGGVGGDAGSGAAGGYSGESEGSAWCADAGGQGGDGGRGGHGGGGGGGCGGPSYGIFLWGPDTSLATSYENDNDFVLTGAAGQGGVGGKSMGNAGMAGLTGAAAEVNF